MPRTKKTAMKKSTPRKTIRRKASERRDYPKTDFGNVVVNFRGSEDIFWTKVVKGLKKFLEPSFK
jgi:hypothetical protein